MANEQRTSELILRLKLDEQSQSRAESGLNNFIAQVRKSSGIVDKLTASSEDLAKSYDKVADAAKRAADSQDHKGKGGAEFRTFDAAIAGFGLRSVGDIAKQLGLDELQKELRVASDVTLFASSLDALGRTTKQVLDVASQAPGAIGAVATALGSGPLGIATVAGAAVVALIALGLGLEDVKNKSEAAAKAEADRYKEHKREVELQEQNINKIKSTSSGQNATDISVLAKKAADAKDTLDSLKAQKKENDAAYTRLGGSVNPLERSRLGAVGQTLDKEIEDATNTYKDYSAQLKNSASLVKEGIKNREDEEAVTQKLLSTSNERVKTEERTQQLLKLNSTSAKERVDAIEDERAAIRKSRQQLIDSGNTSDEVKKQIEAYRVKLVDLKDEEKLLTNTVIPLIKAREDEAAAAKKSEEFSKKQAKQRDDLVNATEKYGEDVKKLNEDELQSRIDIEKRYADQLVDIARKAAEDREDAAIKQQEKAQDLFIDENRDLAKLERDFARDQQKEQAKAQQEEAKAYRDHAQRMQEIRDSYADREQDAMLERNFLSLFQLQRDKVRDLQKENTKFTTSQADRQREAQETARDAKARYDAERTERIIAYLNSLEDARLQYQRQLGEQMRAEQRARQAAAMSRDNDYRDLNYKIGRERELKWQGYQNELRMVMLTENAKLQIYANSLVQAYSYARQLGYISGGERESYYSTGTTYNASRGSMTIRRYAAGGNMGAGQWGLVNDDHPGQRESFNGKPINTGMGLFMPFSAGYVNPGGSKGGGFSLTLNMPITSNNPEATGQVVERIIRTRVPEILEEYIG